MELRGEGENKVLACACGHREKLSAYKKRRDEEKGNYNKKEVSNYLRNQTDSQPLNTALADALAKLKQQ